MHWCKGGQHAARQVAVCNTTCTLAGNCGNPVSSEVYPAEVHEGNFR
jgi:hypothetical protein